MKDKLILQKERKINAPVSKVWKIITESTSDWNGIIIKTKTDWKPGSDIFFVFEWDGKEFQDKGKILEYEEDKVFAHSYWSAFSGLPDSSENYSKVKYELIDNGNHAVLKLTHSDFATQKMYDDSDSNWESTLDNIKTKAEKK